MKNLRKYGKAPYNVAVIHGGPGAPGEMAPVARELSCNFGVLEPLQTKLSIKGQVKELHDILKKNGSFPIILTGWSWGAWLSFIFAAKHPEFIEKLILVSSGPFEEKYATKIMKTRLSRLDDKDRKKLHALAEALDNPTTKDKNSLMAQLGKLISKADSYKPILVDDELVECQYEVYQKVWKDAEKLRRGGKLLNLGRKIKCPTTAIHGDYDPHSSEGVKGPLSQVLKNFRFILLKNCGHHPWLEKEAKNRFYKILREELV